MLHILGGLGLGLVWGWLAARILYRAHWVARLRILLGVAVQALVVQWLATSQAVMLFTIATGLSGLVGTLWLRRLAARANTAV